MPNYGDSKICYYKIILKFCSNIQGYYNLVLKMKLSLNTNSKFLRAPSIRQFSNRMKHIDDCVNLTIGQPDFPMPDVVKGIHQCD